MSYGMVPPPKNISKPSLKHNQYTDGRLMKGEFDQPSGGKFNPIKFSGKKSEDINSYFDKDSDDEESEPANSMSDKDEEDELDAFMAEINQKAKQEAKESMQKQEHVSQTGDYEGGQSGRDDIEKEDMQESMINFMEEYNKRIEEEEADLYEYDEDGNIIWTWKKEIDPLPPIDHSTILYKPFDKNLYEEHEDIRNLSPKDVFEMRIALNIRIYGTDPPRPIASFAHFQFDKLMMSQIRKSEFERPTPIQAQAVPAALSGRDVIGLAKTGSGKTLAYVWPAIVHIMNQPEISIGEGPVALIVIPTRELAIQVYNEARRYALPYNINIVCAYGGGSKYEQSKALEEGAELVIGTPGRIIDLVKMEATNFLRTTFLVFDEVDRMFDLGFEAQVKSIADHVRPDRQCLVFSATMKPRIEKLVVHALFDPIKIVCGDVGEANTDVQQTVLIMPDINAKHNWLFSNIVKFITMGKLLIFVTKKVEAEDLAKKLKYRDIECVLLHGDMHQQERNERITSFRTKTQVMVATDVAARGLDITEIRNVVNFDVARDIDTHVHRIGRTGRAGQSGFAHTLVTDKDSEFSAHLVKNLQYSDQSQAISDQLLALALKTPWFKSHYEKGQKEGQTEEGRQMGFARTSAGFGFKPKERPGFGLSNFGSASKETTVQQPTITKQIERAKSIAGTGNVKGLNRVEMMRSALKNTFKTSFKPSTTNESESWLPASDPRPEWKIRLDEQTEKINKAILEKSVELHDQEDANDLPKKKRSRWDK